MANFDNLPPPTTAFIDSDNNIQDLQAFAESGAIVVTAVGSAGPVTPIGEATVPKFDNIAPWAGKFLNPSNEIIDLINYLSSGAIQVQVAGGAPSNQTFVTNTDETDSLPNSVQLLGTANQINAINGTLSLSSTLILPGNLTAGGTIDINGYALIDTTDDIVRVDANILKIRNKLSGIDTTTYTQFDTDEIDFFSNNVGALSITSSVISSFVPVEFNQGTTFLSTMQIASAISRYTQTDNNITLGNATQTFNIASSSIIDLASSGFRIGGTGARVTSISTDGTFSANSDTLLATQKASKTYTDAHGANAVTLANASLIGGDTLVSNGSGPNLTVKGITAVQGLNLVANGTDILLGFLDDPTTHTNYVLASNGTNYRATNSPTLAQLTLGAGITVNNITNSPTASASTDIMSAEAVQAAIANQVSGAKSFRGGYDASTNLFPTTGGSGIAGAVQAGDVWTITVAGTLGGTPVYQGDTLLALVNTPGQTAGNWSINVNGVATVFGRSGTVTAQSGDYSFSLISGTAATTQGGTGLTAYTTGDILSATATNTLSRLSIGSTGQVLTVVGGVAAWASPAVTTVFSRSGAITAQSGDYSFSLISGTAATTQGGTGLTSYTTGDILYASATNTLSKLGIGTDGQVLTLVSGVPAWAAVPSDAVTSVFGRTGAVVAATNDYNFNQIAGTATPTQGGTGLTSYAAGDIIFASAINTLSKLTAGTNGQYLTLSAGLPAWAAAPVVSVFGRTGTVTAQSGDYSFSLISGTAAVSQGGTGATSIGASGTLAQSNGSIYAFTTATYPSSAGSAGTFMRSDGTNWLASTATLPNTGGASGTILQSNGSGFVNSTATYPGAAGTAGTLLRSNATNFINSTATFADTYSASSLLYSNGANAVQGLATANSAVLVTSSTGVPSLSSTMTNGQIIIGSTGATPSAATITQGTNIAVTNGAASITIGLTGTVGVGNGGTGNTSVGASGTLAQSDGTKYTFTTATYPAAGGTNGTLLRSNGTNFLNSTSTFADTYAINRLLYASSANTVTGLATTNSASLATTSGGVPTWLALTDGQIVIGSTLGAPAAATLAAGTNIAITNASNSITVGLTGTVGVSNGGTGNTSVGANGTLAQSDGTKYTFTTATYPTTAGTSGTILRSNGSNIVNSTATYPGTAGTAGTILRSDGTNIVNSTPTFPNTGTSGKLIRGDGTNYVETTAQYPNTATNAGTILRADGTNWAATTATYPNNTTVNRILYSSSTNIIGEITSANSAVLVTNSSGVPSFSSSMTNGQLIIGSTSGTPTPAALTAGSGVTITNGSGSITIAASGGGMTWNTITGTSVTAVANNGYIANNAATVTVTLPATAAVGDAFAVTGINNATGWKLAVNTGQTIKFGTSTTTTSTGYLQSTNTYDSVTVVCTVANTTFTVIWGPVGNITVV